MAKASAKTSKPKSPKAKSASPSGAEFDPRTHLYAVAEIIAKEKGFAASERELWALVDEQFIDPAQRAPARFQRGADEMLCQSLERDVRFQEAVAEAKGGLQF